MEKIKVAHIITDLDIGGAEKMLLKVLHNFKNNAYEHFVVSLQAERRDSPYSISDAIRKEGFKVYSIGTEVMTIGSAIMSFLKLYAILKKEKPHIVHSYLFHADFLGRIAAKILGVPIVISSLRNENIGGRLRERLLGMTDFCVNRVTAVSKNVAESHIIKGTSKRDKMRVIYNGVELPEESPTQPSRIRREANIEQDTFVILAIAGLEPKKGHLYLFDAVSEIKKRGYFFKLLVVGSGAERKKLEEEVAAKNLQEEVVFMGPREDLPDLFAASDVFILPSLWEGLPNALLEAMTTGLPVIATRVGGVPEVVTDNETGLLVEARDSRGLSNAIERMAGDPALRSRLAQNAKARIREKFDIKKTVADIEKLYNELLEEKGLPKGNQKA